MPNQIQNSSGRRKFDLGERTANLGESVILLCKTIPDTPINRPLISQVVRSSTSVGANYMEADGAESKADFRHKIALCKKEAKETMHWLRMLATSNPEKAPECRRYWSETHELVLIFSSILRPKTTTRL